jgi:tRNA pseudouridine38-40 synthase
MSLEPPIRTLKLTLAYDGTQFVGWQRQAAGQSIQGLVEAALSRLGGTKVSVEGAGRTDAGVHALGQVASARVATTLGVATIGRAVNAMLPPEVRVITIEDMPENFHARYRVSSKTYQYRIHTGEVLSPFDRSWCWHLPRALSVGAMQDASRVLVGSHDFAVFQSSGSSVKTSTRTVVRADWRVIHAASNQDPGVEAAVAFPSAGRFVIFEIEADGFLRHMVRSIVGTLVEVGEGRRRGESIGELLASGNRALAGPTAPARGLFLLRVTYPE